jgi:hypothetical protein
VEEVDVERAEVVEKRKVGGGEKKSTGNGIE